MDASGEAEFFINYLNFIDSVPEFRVVEERSYQALGLKNGDRILDAGCGIGLDSCRLSSLIGNLRRVIGFDSSESMLSIAEKNVPESVNNVSFVSGDLLNPDFPDNYFDAIYMERVLQISPDPRGIMRQLVRMLKPGGTMVSIEPDWGTMALDPGDRNRIRSLISYCADSFPDGWTGRKLWRHFKEAGMNVRIEAEPVIMHNYPITARAMNFDNFISGAVQAERSPKPKQRI